MRWCKRAGSHEVIVVMYLSGVVAVFSVGVVVRDDPEVTEAQLLQLFSSRYTTVRGVKLVQTGGQSSRLVFW